MSTVEPTTVVEYRQLPGFDHYRFGRDGSFFSNYGRGMAPPGRWRRLKTHDPGDGYLQVALRANRKTTTKYLHRVILELFVGPCPDDMEACVRRII